jgi:aryl-alcohol dehydrogenase
MEIQAAVLRAPHGPLIIEAVRLDRPRAGEVVVKLSATGICHTDIAITEQLLPLPTPIVLGHEGAGVVVEVGADVKGLSPGDHVVLTFASCGECQPCASDHPAYCQQMMALNFGCRREDGSATLSDERGEPVNAVFFSQSSFATHALSRARSVVKVRDDAPLNLLGPLGCGLMTGAGAVLNVLKPPSGSTLVILGAGALGCAALFAGKLSGCKRIVAVDRVRSRLDLALELGATDVIDTTITDIGEALLALGGVDRALDTTGATSVLEPAVKALNPRGVLALAGASKDPVMSVEIMPFIWGKTIRGVIEGDADPSVFIPFLVDKYMEGSFPIDKISRFYPFSEINAAIADASSGKTVKPILTF